MHHGIRVGRLGNRLGLNAHHAKLGVPLLENRRLECLEPVGGPVVRQGPAPVALGWPE